MGGALGAGRGRGAFAVSEFPDHGGATFRAGAAGVTEFTSPRAWAFSLIGIHEYLRRLSGDRLVNQTRETLTRGSWSCSIKRPSRTGPGLKGS